MTIRQDLNSKQAEAKRLWTLACEHEGIEPTSQFVVFSDGNPYATEAGWASIEYNKALLNYRKIMSVVF